MAISKRFFLLGLSVRASDFLPQTQLIIAAMIAGGDTPTVARAALIDTYVAALIANGEWAALDVLIVAAAAAQSSALINWRNPGTFDAQIVNTVTFVADRGFTGDGVAGRVRIPYTPSTDGVNFTQNSAQTAVWILTNAANNTSDIGNLAGNINRIVTRSAGDTLVYRINDNTGDALAATTDSRGLSMAQRRAANDKRLWKNGVQVRSDATASTGNASGEQWFCGASTTGFATKQIALAAWGGAGVGSELGFHNASLAYLQGVGAA